MKTRSATTIKKSDPEPSLPKQQRCRILTSAVEGLTVSEVRKLLLQIRDMWGTRDKGNFSISEKLTPHDFRIYDFCTKFCKGHHMKRHK